jgi:hypothetical protein
LPINKISHRIIQEATKELKHLAKKAIYKNTIYIGEK